MASRLWHRAVGKFATGRRDLTGCAAEGTDLPAFDRGASRTSRSLGPICRGRRNAPSHDCQRAVSQPRDRLGGQGDRRSPRSAPPTAPTMRWTPTEAVRSVVESRTRTSGRATAPSSPACRPADALACRRCRSWDGGRSPGGRLGRARLGGRGSAGASASAAAPPSLPPRAARRPARAAPYIDSGAEIPRRARAPARVSCAARTRARRERERSGSAGSTTRASR